MLRRPLAPVMPRWRRAPTRTSTGSLITVGTTGLRIRKSIVWLIRTSTWLALSPKPECRPRYLTADTFGDELKLASGMKSRVVAISWKDRAAIMLGGHSPTAVYWADPPTAHFVTSTYYANALPDWVKAFNAANPAKAYCGKPWQALP